MSVYRTWHDFVRYARDPGRVTSKAQRLDVSVVTPLEEAQPVLGVGVVRRHDIEPLWGTFEATDVTPGGDVTVWTDQYVHVLRRTKLERLRCAPRAPSIPPGNTGKIGEWRDFLLADHAGEHYTVAMRTAVEGLPLWSPSAPRLPSARVTESELVENGDRFEAMFLGNYGAVVLWTEKRVWFINSDEGDEALVALPRNPPAG
jgi:hypothetical protein